MDLSLNLTTVMARAIAFEIPLPARELEEMANDAAEKAADAMVTAEICRDLGDTEGAVESDLWSQIHFSRHCALFNLMEAVHGTH